MAFNSNNPRQEFVATASQTDFVFNFKIYEDSDLKVYQTADGVDPDDATDILTLTTHYTVVVDGDDGGTVTLNSGATLDDMVTILRDLPYTRETDYQTGGDLLAETLDEDQEYQTYLSQQLDAEKGQFLKLPNSLQNADGTLPAPEGDAYFKWNATGTGIENDTTIPDAVTTSAANAAAAAASESAAATSETNAKLFEWEAEAERLTADSYATEAEDTFVNLVTSDGDGTFTYTPTADYSSLHYAAKSASSVSEFGDDVFRIKDNGDTSKKVAFEASGITTATTRTITVPDSDLTMAGNNIAQTFTEAQRTSTAAGDNSIAFNDDNNNTLTATAANITVTNQTIGQGGTIIITTAENITGWGTEFDWGNAGEPTGLTGVETFAYYVSGASGADSIKIGRL